MTKVGALNKVLSQKGTVNIFTRMTQLLLGSPSARRACGSSETSLLPHRLHTRKWQNRRSDTPVFVLDRRGVKTEERLPRIWLSEPDFDAETGKAQGRVFVEVYPNGTDRGGVRALELAERFMGEARSYESADRQVACFQAAEILCLHAAQRGNIQAYVYLAMIYRNDLCAGSYWKSLLEKRARHVRETDGKSRAFACLAFAAQHGNVEAYLQLGDVFSTGYGCVVDHKRAYTLYCRAFVRALGVKGKDKVNASQAGESALRIARCCEEGSGYAQSFEKALAWYRVSCDYLGKAMDEGQWRCKRSFKYAKCGAARMAQEMNGNY